MSLGFRIWGLGFQFQSGFRKNGVRMSVGFRVQGLWFRVSISIGLQKKWSQDEFRVYDLGFKSGFKNGEEMQATVTQIVTLNPLTLYPKCRTPASGPGCFDACLARSPSRCTNQDPQRATAVNR